MDNVTGTLAVVAAVSYLVAGRQTIMLYFLTRRGNDGMLLWAEYRRGCMYATLLVWVLACLWPVLLMGQVVAKTVQSMEQPQ